MALTSQGVGARALTLTITTITTRTTTTTKAFEKILNNIGIPKTIYSDQGSEYKNATFQKLLGKHNIQIMFAFGPKEMVNRSS